MDLHLSLPSRGNMQPTKKKLRAYPLKSLNSDYPSQTPRVHPLKIDWTATLSKTGRSKHDGDETSKEKDLKKGTDAAKDSLLLTVENKERSLLSEILHMRSTKGPLQLLRVLFVIVYMRLPKE